MALIVHTISGPTKEIAKHYGVHFENFNGKPVYAVTIKYLKDPSDAALIKRVLKAYHDIITLPAQSPAHGAAWLEWSQVFGQTGISVELSTEKPPEEKSKKEPPKAPDLSELLYD